MDNYYVIYTNSDGTYLIEVNYKTNGLPHMFNLSPLDVEALDNLTFMLNNFGFTYKEKSKFKNKDLENIIKEK